MDETLAGPIANSRFEYSRNKPRTVFSVDGVPMPMSLRWAEIGEKSDRSESKQLVCSVVKPNISGN